MNEYKISCSTTEGNAQLTIIERSEAAARKTFKANHKGAEISDIELIDVNALATKAQERETLEKIREMIAELGPQSYLAAAFEGCFEDAETNIENNFADSIGKTPIREQAVNAAKVRASETGADVSVTALLDDGRKREVIYKPNGSVIKVWENELLAAHA